ncbi:MAG: PASTA domain-containing protein [Candidatus Krumholzibacteriota bacterium]|nr:PASTA domain-containing protein [Candidatus Krumholzibacteriota bacterium]
MTEKKEKGYHPVVVYLFAIVGAFLGGIIIFNYIILPIVVGRSGTVIVPEIKGMMIRAAEEKCAQSDLKLMVVGERYSSEFPEGYILEQDPGSGESLKEKRTIRVIISSGERLETVPVTRNESLRQTELLLESAHLQKGRLIRIFSHQEGPNRIVATSPPQGAWVPVDSRIDILLSMTGEPRVFMMPDLVGRDLPFVKERLEKSGFHVSRVVNRLDPSKFPNTILSQNPPAGFSIKEGGTIELVVSTVD